MILSASVTPLGSARPSISSPVLDELSRADRRISNDEGQLVVKMHAEPFRLSDVTHRRFGKDQYHLFS